MSSRGKKKTASIVSQPPVPESTFPHKYDTHLNVVLTVGLIAILLCCCLPITGVHFKTDLSNIIGSSSSSQSGDVEMTSSLNIFSLFAMPLNGYSDWSLYLAHHMTADQGSLTESIATSVMQSFFTQSQLDQLNQGMWLLFGICGALLIVWLVAAVLFPLLRKFCKTTLPILIVSWILSAIALVQFVMLIIMYGMGAAGTTFIVNIAAWMLVLLCIGLAVYVTWDFRIRKKYAAMEKNL